MTRVRYTPSFHPDGRKVYNPNRTELDIYDEWEALTEIVLKDDPDCRFPEIKAKEIWRQQEQSGERWKEWQQRVWLPRKASIPSSVLTEDEWVYLADTFNGANHPLAISIQIKANQRVIEFGQ